ncbi:MAG: DUF6883 domain-containing protein, partial [Thermoleophilaceae bacterium]
PQAPPFRQIAWPGSPPSAMPYPEIGQPLPRASDAHATADKWRGWILAPHGHGREWARVFDVEPDDSEGIWHAIAAAVLDVPVSTVLNRPPHGVVCGVEVELTINDRTARVATAWHYADEGASPRLVTAYPSP